VVSSLAALRAHKAVESVDYQRGTRYETGNVFVCLKPGWHWDQQRSYGCDTIKEAWELTRQVEYDPEGFGRPDQ